MATSPKFTLRQLEVFVAVARSGNVTRAAETLHLSPSAISAALTELEHSVGSKLCTRRRGRGVTMTPEGWLFQRLATRLLDDAGELADSLSELVTGEVSGPLRLGYFPSLAATFLPPLIERLAIQHPAASLELHEDVDRAAHTRLLDGMLDAVLGYVAAAHPDLASVPVARRKPYVIVHVGHWAANQKRVQLAALSDEPLISTVVGPDDKQVATWFERAGVTPHPRHTTQDVSLTKALVGRGIGYAVLLQRQSHPYTLDGGEIRAVEVDPVIEPITVYLTYLRRSHHARRVRTLVDTACETFAAMPPWSGVLPPGP